MFFLLLYILEFIGVYVLWFNFILGLNFNFLCVKLIIIHYHSTKQRKIKFKPRIKLNHNICYTFVTLLHKLVSLLGHSVSIFL